MNVAPDSLAGALAIMVFPHPGGPKRRTPFGRGERKEVGVEEWVDHGFSEGRHG